MSPNLTGYCEPCDMGIFTSVKKRFLSYRRKGQIAIEEHCTKCGKIMIEFTPGLVRCLRKVTGLIDANDSEDARLGQIIETDQ